jgi:hypothetical protein
MLMEDIKIKCSGCQVELTSENGYFSRDKKYKNRGGLLHLCRMCSSLKTKKWCASENGKEKHRLSEARRRSKNREKYLWLSAKRRAELKGWDFNIEISDIVIPERCPVFGCLLRSSDGINLDKKHSPSIDRINPEKGYIKGNIAIISNRANVLKNDASLEEIEKLAIWFKNISNKK